MFLKIITCNIMHDSYSTKHNSPQICGNNKERFLDLIEKLEEEKPDVLLLQEVSDVFLSLLKSFYKCSRLKVFESKKDFIFNVSTAVVILNEEIDVFAAKPLVLRNGSLAELLVCRYFNQTILFSSIHLKGSQQDSHLCPLSLNDLKEILVNIGLVRADVKIIGGDFNKNLLSKRSLRLKELQKNGFKIFFSSSLGNTTDLNSAKTVDAILLQGKYRLEEYKILPNIQHSAHLPVMCRIEITNKN